MGKICGLKYYYKNQWYTLKKDYCDHIWDEYFGLAKTVEGATTRIGIQYNCEYPLGCKVWFDLTYETDKETYTYGPFSVGYGKNWIEFVIHTPIMDQAVTVLAWEKDFWGNRVNQDQIYFYLMSEKQVFNPDITEFTISPTTLKPGESATATVKVKNYGNVGGWVDIVITSNGTEVHRESVFLMAGEEKTKTYSITFPSVGQYEICAKLEVS